MAASAARTLSAAAMALWAAACGELPTQVLVTDPAPPTSFTALRVEENRIVDAGGADVILRGVAVVDPLVGRGFRYQPRPSQQDLETLVREWGAGIVRVPMHPDLMANHPAYLRDFVDPPGRLGRAAGALPAAGLPRPRQSAHRRGRGHPLGLRSPLERQPLRPDLGLALAPWRRWPPATGTGPG